MALKRNITEEKAIKFALEAIELYKRLIKNNEFVLSKQFLRSATSIGANIMEAQHAQSDRDFLNKMSIALKEARETEYWLELLERSGYLVEENKILISSCKELNRILITIVKKINVKCNM